MAWKSTGFVETLDTFFSMAFINRTGATLLLTVLFLCLCEIVKLIVDGVAFSDVSTLREAVFELKTLQKAMEAGDRPTPDLITKGKASVVSLTQQFGQLTNHGSRGSTPRSQATAPAASATSSRHMRLSTSPSARRWRQRCEDLRSAAARAPS